LAEDRVRLFVALELPEVVRAVLSSWRDEVVGPGGPLRPVANEALHVTLCFLGWRGEHEIETITGACRVVAGEPAPALSLGAPLWLPRRRPRVLALELEDSGAGLARVQSALSHALSAGGWYEPENRPHLAHVTVARVKAGGAQRPAGRGQVPARQAGERLPELPAPPRLNFHASRVVLYRSRLSHTGARYEPLSIVQLAAGDFGT
jgi:RNA 2',3'-cyclic 3'-phosphodiesterase